MKSFFKFQTLVLLFAVLTFQSCTKEDPQPSETQVTLRGEHGPLSWNEVCPGDDLVLVLTGVGNKQIQQLIDGFWVPAGQQSSGTNTLTATIPNVQEGTYNFRYKLGSGGFTNVNITVESCCELTGQGNTFTGAAGEGSCGNARSATYTFCSEFGVEYYKMQGGLTNFSGGDAIVTVSGGDSSVNQRTPGNSSNRVITVEGSVGECSCINVVISWYATNGNSTITGEWSVKDAGGNNLAPEVAALNCN